MSRTNDERIRALETTVERLLAVLRFLRSLFGAHLQPEHHAQLDAHIGAADPAPDHQEG